MRKLILLLSLLLALVIVRFHSRDILNLTENAQFASMHEIEMRGVTIEALNGVEVVVDDKQCTAYSIGPHALLTAQHCLLPGTDIKVDSVLRKITQEIVDGNGHAILYIDGPAFKYYLRVLHISPKSGLAVHTWGNPMDAHAFYRMGYYVGSIGGADIYDMRVFPGDSGSAIIDNYGRIVGVVEATAHGFTVSMPFEYSDSLDKAFQ